MTVTADYGRTINNIAKVAHEANRAYCETLGDHSQLSWAQAPEWQRGSVMKGVEYRLAHPDAPISAQHEAWMAEKLAQGWTYGEVKDPSRKIHPCLVPYDQLSEAQRVKDKLFVAVVEALRPHENN